MGNVLAVISDKKIQVSSDNVTVSFCKAYIESANDYYPFGMQMPMRTYTASSSVSNYRYGFNGIENDNEVKGTGNQQDYGMRIYDPRVGKFLSVDPLTKNYPMLTPYQFASNKPIVAIDLDGAEAFMKTIQYNSSGKATAVNIMYDESVKALPVGQMYVQHAYPTGSVMKTEGLGTLDFSDKSYGYSNKAGHKDYAVREEYNPFYNPSDVNKTTLFSEFMTSLGPENSLIIGGKMR